MAIVTISSRSRNIGYGWTNQPVKRFNNDGSSYLVIAPVYAPDVTGTPRQVLAEVRWAQRVNNGNDWRGALFVSDRRVNLNADDGLPMSVADILEYLCEERNARLDVVVED